MFAPACCIILVEELPKLFRGLLVRSKSFPNRFRCLWSSQKLKFDAQHRISVSPVHNITIPPHFSNTQTSKHENTMTKLPATAPSSSSSPNGYTSLFPTNNDNDNVTTNLRAEAFLQARRGGRRVGLERLPPTFTLPPLPPLVSRLSPLSRESSSVRVINRALAIVNSSDFVDGSFGTSRCHYHNRSFNHNHHQDGSQWKYLL